MNEKYEMNHPELVKEDRYTSPASSLPLHELKLLQDYIHSANLQNIGTILPTYKKQMVLLKFFKSKKNQVVEVFSRNESDVHHTIGKVSTIGRDFVMIKTLFTRYWIPYKAIHAAKSPFGIPDISAPHQHVVVDAELRRKLLTNFGSVVAEKEVLRQQFYEELLETNLKNWRRTRCIIFAGKVITGKIQEVHSRKLFLQDKSDIDISKINYIKQTRFISWIEQMLAKRRRKE